MKDTSYHAETDLLVINALEAARQDHTRVRIFFGDVATGKSWLEENDIEGYIGRSTGTVKVPLLIHNSRSIGGIIDHCIIRIIKTKSKMLLYNNPKFHTAKLEVKECKLPLEQVNGKMEFYLAEVYADGNVHARFRTVEKAQRWVKKMQG